MESFNSKQQNDEDEEDVEMSSLHEIISYLKLYPNGVTLNKMSTDLQLDKTLMANSINTLFEQNRLIIENSKTEGNIFKLLSDKEFFKLRDLTGEDQRVYEIVISAGSNGITLNELKMQLGIAGNALQRIRKKLEKKLLIKNVTVPNMKNKKVILGYDIEPSNELKGGFWCTNQQFDKCLIETISGKIVDYLYKQKVANRKEILTYIKTTGLVSSDIKEEDLQNIINLLVFDDKIDIASGNELFDMSKYSLLLKKQEAALASYKYKLIPNYLEDFNIIESVPCTFCPVFKFCHSDNVINPSECRHLAQFYDELI